VVLLLRTRVLRVCVYRPLPSNTLQYLAKCVQFMYSDRWLAKLWPKLATLTRFVNFCNVGLRRSSMSDLRYVELTAHFCIFFAKEPEACRYTFESGIEESRFVHSFRLSAMRYAVGTVGTAVACIQADINRAASQRFR
jgi:hypothetical protein